MKALLDVQLPLARRLTISTNMLAHEDFLE